MEILSEEGLLPTASGHLSSDGCLKLLNSFGKGSKEMSSLKMIFSGSGG